MQSRISILLVALFAYISNTFAFDADQAFKEANEAYDAQQYDSAYVQYQSIENQGLFSVELYQNLGTCAYKMNNVPGAVYYFEKGLKFSPGNDDLEHNLKLANQRVTDKSDLKSNSGIIGWLSQTIGGTADLWAKWSVWAGIIGAIAILLYLFINSALLKKIGLISGVSLWFLAVIFVLFAYVQNSVLNNMDFGILFKPTAEIKNEPSDVSSTAFVLHEGSKVQILEENKLWVEISFGKNKVGWVKKSDIKRI